MRNITVLDLQLRLGRVFPSIKPLHFRVIKLLSLPCSLFSLTPYSAVGRTRVVIQSKTRCSNHCLLIGFIILTRDLRWVRISWLRSAAMKTVILMRSLPPSHTKTPFFFFRCLCICITHCSFHSLSGST